MRNVKAFAEDVKNHLTGTIIPFWKSLDVYKRQVLMLLFDILKIN